MKWSPPWMARSLGAFDSSALADWWFDQFERKMRAAKLHEKLAERQRRLPLIDALYPAYVLMDALSAQITIENRLHYIVKFQPTYGTEQGDAREGILPSGAGTGYGTIVRIYVPLPEDPTERVDPKSTADQYYATLRRWFTDILTHEFQHALQLVAARGGFSERQYAKDRYARKDDPRIRRLYLSDPIELIAFASQIAADLRIARIRRLGFPASEEALGASYTLRDYYDVFDSNVPAEARVLKDLTIKVARFL